MSQDESLRDHLLFLLRGGRAHVKFDDAVENVPADLRGKRPKGLEHSLWEILEHIRIAQWDILEFSRDAKHISPDWPSGYWPKSPAPPNAAAWDDSIRQIREDLEQMGALIMDPKNDLYTRIPHGDGQTLLREALLVSDHNAYHLGEFVTVRRLLGTWK